MCRNFDLKVVSIYLATWFADCCEYSIEWVLMSRSIFYSFCPESRLVDSVERTYAFYLILDAVISWSSLTDIFDFFQTRSFCDNDLFYSNRALVNVQKEILVQVVYINSSLPKKRCMKDYLKLIYNSDVKLYSISKTTLKYLWFPLGFILWLKIVFEYENNFVGALLRNTHAGHIFQINLNYCLGVIRCVRNSNLLFKLIFW